MNGKSSYRPVLFIPVLLILGMTQLLNGCAGSTAGNNSSARGTTARPEMKISTAAAMPSSNVLPSIFQVAQGLAFQLSRNLREGDMASWPCIVTTFADIDNLDSSSRFGRLLAEAVSSELFRQGAVIRDVRSAKALLVQPRKGELILSRNIKALPGDTGARAVIAGTYARGASSVAVNIRMIDLETRAVISVAMTELARTRAIEALLLEPAQNRSLKNPVPTSYDRQIF
ncbi:MAG: hypothetical protein DSZ23_03245 [Thermodesulfatator sp.]|nr:MAG: hypothetical protein DSZ23_03245 [Thermodesulfatator sp.]